MAKLLCPACKKHPLESTSDSQTGLEVDSCSECLGIWFDAGELQQFYQSKELVQRFTPVGGDSLHHTYEISTSARRCPRCRKAMERPLVGGISVDVCRDCRGIWFDQGELQKVTQIYKSRGLKGDELVTDQVRKGVSGKSKDANPVEGAFSVVSWFFNSFLSTRIR
jgi:Zn-finger nucleic acid-binding protein